MKASHATFFYPSFQQYFHLGRVVGVSARPTGLLKLIPCFWGGERRKEGNGVEEKLPKTRPKHGCEERERKKSLRERGKRRAKWASKTKKSCLQNLSIATPMDPIQQENLNPVRPLHKQQFHSNCLLATIHLASNGLCLSSFTLRAASRRPVCSLSLSEHCCWNNKTASARAKIGPPCSWNDDCCCPVCKPTDQGWWNNPPRRKARAIAAEATRPSRLCARGEDGHHVEETAQFLKVPSTSPRIL